jgi:hypothetical protein
MSRAPALVIGGIVVLAAAVGLVVLLSSSAEDDAAKPATPIGDGLQKPVVPPPAAPVGGTSVTVTDVPRGPAGTEAGKDPGEKADKYTVDGVPVRDHRTGDNAPMDLPPNIHPAEARMIPSQLTAAISGQVRKVMMECVQSLPREGRGTKPRLEGQIDVSIKKQTLTVTKSAVQLRDLENTAGVDAVKACVESKSVGLTTAAANEADLDDYSIRLSYAIP